MQSTFAAANRRLRDGAGGSSSSSGRGGGSWSGRQGRDPELLSVLELAADEELDDLYQLLNSRSLFSPLLKSLVREREHVPAALGGGRDELIACIEGRLRFLAADPGATVRGRWPSYR